MAILTKFLKLLKPERNDYVDVEKHLSENYDKIDTKMEGLSNSNDKKLDKGAVSSEYDTAKKIEDKIKTSLMHKGILSGINSSQELLNLEPGIYTISEGNIFDIQDNGWFTVIKYFDKNRSDQIVKVYYTGSSDAFFLGAFNSHRWQGWKRYDSCPYNIGDIYITANAANPSTVWLGTTWRKIENRFLYGTTNSSETTGGSNNVYISKNNLPNVKIPVDSFALNRGNMNITGSLGYPTTEVGNYGRGAFSMKLTSGGRSAGSGGNAVEWDFDASKSWTGTTSSASPYTSALGSGVALNIMPQYYTVFIWQRLS